MFDPAAKRTLGRVDLALSAAGFGAAPIGNLFTPISEPVASSTLAAAWAGGVRYVDTAPEYGNGLSELRIGAALAGWARDEFVISTKVGCALEPGEPEPGMYVQTPRARTRLDYSYDGALRQIEGSLERLGTDRVEIVLIHDADLEDRGPGEPTLFDVAMDGAYRAILELREQGVICAIGVGVNEVELCLTAAERGDFDCFLLAGRYTLLEQSPLDELLPLCERRGIALLLGGVFNSGILARGARDGARYHYEQAGQDVVRRVEAIERACAEFDVPIGAAAAQFPLAHPVVTSIALGARTPEQQRRTLSYLRHDIPPALWSALRTEGVLREDAPVPA